MDELTQETKSPIEPEAPGPVQQKPPDTPSLGIDESGYFTVRVHASHGEVFILGWLCKAQDFIKNVAAKSRADAQNKKIITPTTKGFGRFNIFK